MSLTALSLFAGAGGLDVGVEQAGFKTACSVETDPHCLATLQRNATKGKIAWQVDVRALDPLAVAEVTNIDHLTLLHGGPPCQPFSQIGVKRGFSDPRGNLVFEMVRFTKALRPSAVMIEQVPKFLDTLLATGMTAIDAICEEFASIGYNTKFEVLDATEFGVPQKRRRALIVCVPFGQSFEFPKPTIKSPVTVGHAFSGLPSAVRSNEEPLAPNHVDVTPDRDRYRISFVSEGQWLSRMPDAPADAVRSLTRKDTTKFRRLHRNEPSLTLRCGEAPFHPIEDRYITPREAARIQGFPDRHILVGPIRRRTGNVRDLDQHRQIANAVPPPLAKAVAKSIRTNLCL